MENCKMILDIPFKKNRIQQISGVVYEQVSTCGYDNVALKMDLLVPRQRKRIPAVVFVTGGQFIHANRDNCIQLRFSLAEAGYVVASIEYRTAPTAIFPEPIEDVKAAIRYLRANAERFHIDDKNIGIVGESSGGYLAAFAGVTNGITRFDRGEYLNKSSAVQAVVDLYGPSDLSAVGADFTSTKQRLYYSAGSAEALWINGIGVFGGVDGGVLADRKRLEEANPISYIKKSTPPFLLMHGDRDQMVSPSQTEILHEALLKAGLDSTRYLVKNAGHGGLTWVQPVVEKIIQDFLDRHLR